MKQFIPELAAESRFYHSMGVATQLTEHGDDKEAAIDAVIKQLNNHGMVALTENQSVTPTEVKQILTAAIA